MYNAVINYSDASAAVTAAIAAYGTTLTAFKAKVTAITTTGQLEAQVISGITISKADLKKALCTSTTGVAAALFAYASSISDAELKEKANYSYSDLFKLKDDELPLIVQNIHDEANTVVASLTPYGITAATLTAFQALIDQYSNKVSAPRNAKAQRAAYMEQLLTLFKEADAMLKNQLDKVALQLKPTQPDFYIAYKNNRIIIDAATSATQVTGTAKSSPGNNPVSGATVSVIGKTYSATTDATGKYILKIPIPGTYSITCSHPSHGEATRSDVIVILGNTTIVDFTLSPA